jgi:predicted ribonuclease YlaK
MTTACRGRSARPLRRGPPGVRARRLVHATPLSRGDRQSGGREYPWFRGPYIPDTNALIYNPKLEGWSFEGSPQFVLLLMPTVLSELDQMKLAGRNKLLRGKADRLVRQIMEYRRRGNLLEGVPLRKGSHRLRTLAIEPDFKNSLPWLDPGNNDDRILAGFVEVMRQHPRCPVVLVTRDINLTNKADYAKVPCVLPPEPTRTGRT